MRCKQWMECIHLAHMRYVGRMIAMLLIRVTIYRIYIRHQYNDQDVKIKKSMFQWFIIRSSYARYRFETRKSHLIKYLCLFFVRQLLHDIGRNAK